MSKGQPPTNNAKDKSNSDALVPACGDRNKEGCGRILVGCSSEKDSGYSDSGSDRQQTDAGVLRRGVAGQSGAKGHGEVPGQSHVQGRSNQAPHRTETNALMVPGSGDVSPIYIIQNLMLNQERSAIPGVVDKVDLKQNRGQLLWTNPRGGSGGPRAGQVLLLQQTSMVPAPPPPALPRDKPQTRIMLGTGRRKLSSFLRIAPHPSKTPPENTEPSQGLQHLSKRVLCPEVKREEPASASSSSRLLPTSSPLSSERQTSPSSSSISSSSALRATKGPPGTSPTGAARYRRFLNTMKVLKQSGLLDITLRTQELMRRSTATEQDIGQLGQHTRLLCQLASQPGTASAATGDPSGRPPWEKLHQAMAQSGGYPSLEILHHEPHSPGRSSDLTVSPSSSSSPGLNQNTAGSEPSGKVTVMPPDSSTG